MQEGISRAEAFASFARSALPSGVSANQIISGARELGIGLQRAHALDIVREIRAELTPAAPAAFIAPAEVYVPAEAGFRWGEAVQLTDEWERFDGPHAILFQNTGETPDEWLDYVIVPEDEDYIAMRLVVQDDDYIDPARPGSGYRTTQSMPATMSPADAARRMGLDPGRVARVIYDKP